MFRKNTVGSLHWMMLLVVAAVTACGPVDSELESPLESDSDPSPIQLGQQESGLTQSELELIDALKPSLRWRRVNEYAHASGFAAGFNNYHWADYGSGIVHGTILINSHAVEFRDVPLFELGYVDLNNIPGMLSQAMNYASRNGFAGALPSFHQGNNEQGTVRGVYLFRPGQVSFVDVPTHQLRNYSFSIHNVREMMTAAHDYARARGYAGGLPTFHEATYNGVVYRGILLIPYSTGEWRDVYVTEFDTYWPERCTPTQTPTCKVYCNGVCVGFVCFGNSHGTVGPTFTRCAEDPLVLPTGPNGCEYYTEVAGGYCPQY